VKTVSITDLLDGKTGHWVVSRNISRRYLYHAAKLHTPQLDGVLILYDQMLSLFTDISTQTNTDKLYYYRHDFDEPKRVGFPYFDTIKQDYTADQQIHITPAVGEIFKDLNKLMPGETITFDLNRSSERHDALRMFAVADRFEHLSTLSSYAMSAFAFYETMWMMRKAKIELCEQVSSTTLTLVHTPKFNYD